jgi:hypothetical protein
VKVAVLWAVALCSLVETYRSFKGACYLHHQGTYRPDDGGSKRLQNDSKFLADYTGSCPHLLIITPMLNILS